jgi:hypothetical protein
VISINSSGNKKGRCCINKNLYNKGIKLQI